MHGRFEAFMPSLLASAHQIFQGLLLQQALPPSSHALRAIRSITATTCSPTGSFPDRKFGNASLLPCPHVSVLPCVLCPALFRLSPPASTHPYATCIGQPQNPRLICTPSFPQLFFHSAASHAPLPTPSGGGFGANRNHSHPAKQLATLGKSGFAAALLCRFVDPDPSPQPLKPQLTADWMNPLQGGLPDLCRSVRWNLRNFETMLHSATWALPVESELLQNVNKRITVPWTKSDSHSGKRRHIDMKPSSPKATRYAGTWELLCRPLKGRCRMLGFARLPRL